MVEAPRLQGEGRLVKVCPNAGKISGGKRGIQGGQGFDGLFSWQKSICSRQIVARPEFRYDFPISFLIRLLCYCPPE
jgi:hypothetical protein